jgi:Ca2+/Na+ antiporter
LVILAGLFTLAFACYLLFVISDPLEKVGGQLGRLLRLPEEVIASTFQALATSGPEIIMAVLAATTFIAGSAWESLHMGERASSGTLNMAFSAMDNLLGIGCLAMLLMLHKGTVRKDEVIKVSPAVKVGLVFYMLSSMLLGGFIQGNSHWADRKGEHLLVSFLTETQAWILAGVGILFVVSQFFVPKLLGTKKTELLKPRRQPVLSRPWLKGMSLSTFKYFALVFGLWLAVKACLGATFNMATVGLVSVGGILLMFTSYVSSFPEFMLAYRYTVADKRSAVLGMLFGSNVIDLAFAGFRAMWLHEPFEVYTTGPHQQLFPYYIWALPAVASLIFLGLGNGWLKYGHARYLVVFYVFYIVSGFILL